MEWVTVPIVWKPYPANQPGRQAVVDAYEFLVTLRTGRVTRWHYSPDLWHGFVIAFAEDPQPYSPRKESR